MTLAVDWAVKPQNKIEHNLRHIQTFNTSLNKNLPTCPVSNQGQQNVWDRAACYYGS